MISLKFDIEKLVAPQAPANPSKVGKLLSFIKPVAISKTHTFIDDLFFKKYNISGIKKEEFKRVLETFYGQENIYSEFADMV